MYSQISFLLSLMGVCTFFNSGRVAFGIMTIGRRLLKQVCDGLAESEKYIFEYSPYADREIENFGGGERQDTYCDIRYLPCNKIQTTSRLSAIPTAERIETPKHGFIRTCQGG